MSGLGGVGHVVIFSKLSILQMEKLRPRKGNERSKITHLKSCPQQSKGTLYPKELVLYFLLPPHSTLKQM